MATPSAQLADRPIGGAILASTGLVALALFAFLLAFRSQVGRLRAPGAAGVGYGALRGDDPAAAICAWWLGHDRLAAFHPVSPPVLVRIHAGAETLLALALTTFLVLLVTRITAGRPGGDELSGAGGAGDETGQPVAWAVRRHPRLRSVGIGLVVTFALSTAAIVLFDLALAASMRPGSAGTVDDRYAVAYRWIGGLRIGALAGVAAVVLAALGPRVPDALRAYRSTPATARVAFWAALGVAALFQAGDLGAQCEDILRREVAASGGWALLRVFAAYVAFVLAVVAASRIRTVSDPDPNRRRSEHADRTRSLLVLGAAVVAGGYLLVRSGLASGPLVAGGMLLVLGVLSWWIGPEEGTPSERGRWAHALLSRVLQVALFVVPLLVAASLWWEWQLEWIAAVVLAVLLAATYAVGRRYADRTAADADEHHPAVYAVAAVLPAAGLATLAGRLVAGNVASHQSWIPLALLELGLVAAAILGGHLVLSGAPEPAERPEVPLWRRPATRAGVTLVGLVALAAVAGRAGTVRPVTAQIGWAAGALGTILLALTAVVVLCALVRVTLASQDQGAFFAVMGLRRTPVIGLLVVWFLLVVVVGAPREHAARSPHLARVTEDRGEELGAGPCPDRTLRDAVVVDPADAPVWEELCRWISTMRLATGKPRQLPLLLVSASGGGVRAATWTARVLDCVLLRAQPADGDEDPCGEARITEDDEGPDLWPHLFAAGGASGGSVGLVSATAEQLTTPPEEVDEEEDPWIRRLAEPDHVAPVVSHLVFGELLPALGGWTTPTDRAEVLIDGWASAFGDVADDACPPLAGRSIDEVGFLRARAACPGLVPLLLLNGTVVGSGDRFNISPFDAAPVGADDPGWTTGSVDLVDVLCEGQDLPLVDAGFLSGRFPLVTPSARFLAADEADDGDPCERDVASAVDVVDGGYLENSGAAQVLDLWLVLERLLKAYDAARTSSDLTGYPAVQPLYLQIENGEDDGSDEKATPAQSEVLERAGHRIDPGLASPWSGGTDVRAGDDLGSELGEPLRPVEAKLHVQHGPAADDQPVAWLRTRLEACGVPTFEMQLYAHPGRALPLGWSLSDPILDDLDQVIQLNPNVEQARRLARWFDGTKAPKELHCP